MIILISGATHTGKTLLAQKMLEKFKYPYLSIDHLKMGLIRTKNTALTPMSSDSLLTEYLWPIICEIIKTAIENEQNLIIEGCYIPFDWEKYFSNEYLKKIKYLCLVMSENYITNHYDKIKQYANIIEKRLNDESSTMENILKENLYILKEVKKYKLNFILIDDEYNVDVDVINNNL